MSLGIGINGPEGVVLAAESRVTLEYDVGGKTAYSSYDNATKILSFNENHKYIGVITYGLATIGQRTAHSFLPDFESNLPTERITVREFAEKLSEFYMTQWQSQTGLPNPYSGQPIVFAIAGFDEGELYGKIYQVAIPTKSAPEEIIASGVFNMVWGGQRDIVDRIIQGIDPIFLERIKNNLSLTQNQINQLENFLPSFGLPLPLNAMALQDCVDLAVFLIRTTIDGQKLTGGLRACGGPIDIAIITRGEGLKYIQKKAVLGERKTD